MVMAFALAAVLAATQPVTASPGRSSAVAAAVEEPDLGGLAISPDGSRVAFRMDHASVDRNDHHLVWWTAPMSGAAGAAPLADGGDAIFTSYGGVEDGVAVWSADGRWLYFRALHDGEVQVWRAPAAGGGAEQVTFDPADVTGFGFAADKTTLVYGVGRARAAILAAEARAYRAGVRLDARVDPLQAPFAAVAINGRLAAERFAGRWFDRTGLLGDQPPRYRALTLATGTVDEASPAEVASAGLVAPPPPPVLSRARLRAVSDAGFGTALVRDTGATQTVLVTRPGSDARDIPCPAATCPRDRIASLVWRPGRDEVILTTRGDDHRQTLWLWSVGRNSIRLLARADGLLNGGSAAARACVTSTAALACVSASAARPPRIERVDLDTGARRVLAAPITPAVDPAALRVETLTWRDSEGRLFSGELFTPAVPPSAGPMALVINYYACDGYVRGGAGDTWPFALAAEEGLASLCINKMSTAGDGQDSVADYRTALSGIAAIVDRLAIAGRIDRQRVGLNGLSFGSEVATWVATESKLAAAVSIASVQVEPAYYWTNAAQGRDVHTLLRQAWGLGAPAETPDRWALISPALKSERLTAPLLMQLPEQEMRGSLELFGRMESSTTPFEAYAFPNEPHILTQPAHRFAAYDRNLDWFRFWLQGYEDPSPDKAEQYRRWRAERETWRGAPAKDPRS